MNDIRRLMNLIEDAVASVSPFAAYGIDGATLSALEAQGFDISEPLYHGTSAEFEQFDRSMSRSAADIYTAPDINTASAYGPNIYLCVGRQDPQADLADDHHSINHVLDTFAEEYEDSVEDDESLTELKANIIEQGYANDPDYDDWDAEDDPRYKALKRKLAREYVYDMIRGGEIYGAQGSFQDRIAYELLGSGYKSIRFLDPSQTGESISVVFGSPEDVKILKKIR
jgi:hypothetical protein